jgi:MoaA/NifB/PqqE/SkfB family radical SAM enzyme
MKTNQIIKIIHKLATNGVKRIIFTGGEPTFIKDLPNILNEAKKSGLTTIISTNGLLLASNPKLLRQITLRLDWIALPLEGDSAESNATMRFGLKPNSGVRQFYAVLKLIKKIKREYPNLKVKLGTVVAQPNINHVVNIPRMLAFYQAIPDTWKLYQISPSGYGKLNYDKLKISDEKFKKVYAKAREQAIKFGIPNVVEYTNSERPGKYIFINPEGDVLIIHPKYNDYYKIGNILDDFNNVIKNWGNYINENSLTKNFEMTYPFS